MTQPALLSELVTAISGGDVLAFPGVSPKEMTELDPEMMETLQAFANARALAAFAKEQKKLLEHEIRAALGTAKVGTIDGREVVSIVDSHTTWYDGDVLTTAYPEAAAAAEKRTDYDWVNVKVRPAGIVPASKKGKKKRHAPA